MRSSKTAGIGSNMKYLVLLALLYAQTVSADFGDDYDVDWPPSNEKGIHVLRIVIGECKTLFRIKDEDYYDVVSNEKAITQALKKAIARAHTGCSN